MSLDNNYQQKQQRKRAVNLTCKNLLCLFLSGSMCFFGLENLRAVERGPELVRVSDAALSIASDERNLERILVADHLALVGMNGVPDASQEVETYAEPITLGAVLLALGVAALAAILAYLFGWLGATQAHERAQEARYEVVPNPTVETPATLTYDPDGDDETDNSTTAVWTLDVRGVPVYDGDPPEFAYSTVRYLRSHVDRPLPRSREISGQTKHFYVRAAAHPESLADDDYTDKSDEAVEDPYDENNKETSTVTFYGGGRLLEGDHTDIDDLDHGATKQASVTWPTVPDDQ